MHPAGRSRRRLCWPLSLALAAPVAQAAAYLPGADPDPPTGDASPPTASAAEPLAGNGIQWRFAPVRWSGTLALDARWLRLEDRSSSRQGGLLADIDGATYLWQPWFAQVRFGAGLIATRESGSADAGAPGSQSQGYTARTQVALFPASRFPFELRADVSDSRTGGEALGQDQRTHRLSLAQSWRPETGSDQYQLRVDSSHLFAEDGRDSLVVIDGSALLQRGPQRMEFNANRADHHRGDGSDSSLLTSLSARHGYHPGAALDIDSLASWHRTQLRADALGDDSLDSELRQLSTLLTWRPRNGELPFALPGSTLVVGSARWVEQRSAGASAAAFSATLGAGAELTPAWRANASLTFNQFDADGGESAQRNASVAASAAWAPRLAPWGAWRWSPSAGLSAGLTRGSGDRDSAGAQIGQALSRDWLGEDGSAVSLSLAQSGAVQSASDELGTTLSRSLAHSVGLVWQGAANGTRQQFASVSAGDSRSFGDDANSFQMINLQWSRRTQITRASSWSGHLTLQFTRSRLDSDDPAAAPVPGDGGWQRFATGTLSWEQQRFWGVPQLRFSAHAGVSTQQLERRNRGDIDAPQHRVSRSLEARLDYTIGRLDARLAVRAARVDERSVASIVARVQRRF